VLTNPKLLKRDGLQVLRADDGEIGVSLGGDRPSRHFFILSKAPPNGKLSLSLAVCCSQFDLFLFCIVYFPLGAFWGS
jgi:hypothetical protein